MLLGKAFFINKNNKVWSLRSVVGHASCGAGYAEGKLRGEIPMHDPTDAAIARLTTQLPLRQRQLALPPAHAALHRAILRMLALQGRAPDATELSTILARDVIEGALARLAADDLVVLDAAGHCPVGAYPLTTEDTPHHLRLNGIAINAMCALDALAVAPMFGTRVRVDSRCHVTGDAIALEMDSEHILRADPSPQVHLGIAWQTPCGHAAHSLCREMVFLRDPAIAAAWQGDDDESHSIYPLGQAVAFASGFFRPLLEP